MNGVSLYVFLDEKNDSTDILKFKCANILGLSVLMKSILLFN